MSEIISGQKKFNSTQTKHSIHLCQMQKVLAFLLICSIMAQTSVRTILTLHYQFNRAQYLTQCENKNKPKLHCNGKCSLKKKMAAQEQGDSKAPSLPDNFRDLQEITLFFQAQPALPNRVVVPEDLPTEPFYQAFMPESPVEDIFKPPV